MPKFEWNRANARSRQFSPGGVVLDGPTTEEWSRSAYEQIVDLQMLTDSIRNDIQATVPKADDPYSVVVPKERCRSCHSSEFDAAGRCAYCRQYQTKGA